VDGYAIPAHGVLGNASNINYLVSLPLKGRGLCARVILNNIISIAIVMPRLKTVLKKVGSTSLVVAFNAPVILYVYSYVLLDCIYSRTNNNIT